jgi:hypothetical protein
MKYLAEKFWCVMMRWAEDVQRSQMAKAQQSIKQKNWIQ